MTDWVSPGIRISFFVVLFAGTLLYMPSELITGVDPIDYNIGTEFDPWYMTGNTTGIEHVISQNSETAYTFSDVTAKHAVKVVWNTWYGIEAVRVKKYVDGNYGLFPNWYNPDLTLSKIEAGWDPNENASSTKISNNQGTVVVYLEDTNTTRNNITQAWIDNSMNCTVIYGLESYENDIWSGKELVLSMLEFRLPNIIGDVNPYMAFIFSAILYVPIAYILLAVTIAVLRGG